MAKCEQNRPVKQDSVPFQSEQVTVVTSDPAATTRKSLQSGRPDWRPEFLCFSSGERIDLVHAVALHAMLVHVKTINFLLLRNSQHPDGFEDQKAD